MNEFSLSKRLETVAAFVEKGAKVADIGSDHAYLPVYLIHQGLAVSAVAGEVNRGPLQAAENQVKKYGFDRQIKTKLGSGLSILSGEDIDTVTIAGMGGPLISDILDEGKSNLTYIKRLILQPNIAADRIRRWLIKHEWQLVDEVILEEDGHIYEVLVAEPGDPLALYRDKTNDTTEVKDDLEKKIWFGPKLLEEKNRFFRKKWLKELEQLEKITKQLESASSSENMDVKKRDVEKKMGWLKEELL